MMTSLRLSVAAGTTLSLALAAQAAAPLPGAVFTTDQAGTLVNGNTTFLGRCGVSGVYLDGGPGPNAPTSAASLPDGDYYFQITDSSGKRLLSTDPVRNRCVTVASGVITGVCPTGTHATFVDQNDGSAGARTVELCEPGVAFLDSTNGVYKLWVTPVGDGTLVGSGFFGDPALVDNDCASGGIPGCFHGFLAARSKTDSFKVRNVATYCIAVEKQVDDPEMGIAPGVNWKISVTDPLGVTNEYYTGSDGTTGTQICGLAAGEYTVREESRDGYRQLSVQLNDQDIGSSSVLVTLGSELQAGDQSVRFVNERVYGP